MHSNQVHACVCVRMRMRVHVNVLDGCVLYEQGHASTSNPADILSANILL